MALILDGACQDQLTDQVIIPHLLQGPMQLIEQGRYASVKTFENGPPCVHGEFLLYAIDYKFEIDERV